MSSLCGCLRGETEPPVPLDAEIQVQGNCSVSLKASGPIDQRRLVYPLFGARRYNFDFLTHDNGETYIATFRAMYRGQVMGHDSKPIPKEIFEVFRVINKKKRGITYTIRLITQGHELYPYTADCTNEELEMLGVI